jgi:phosphonatase-like hydrolase
MGPNLCCLAEHKSLRLCGSIGKMTKIELVIFDLAGTTIDDGGVVPDAFQDTLRSYGISVTPTELQAARGASKKSIIRNLLQRRQTDGNLTEDIFLALQRNLMDRYQHGGVKPIPGAVETFQFLRSKNIKIAFTTGFDRTITDLLLHSLQWDRDIADAMVCSDDVVEARPAPYLIFHAMELTRVNRVNTVANVGDTLNDLHSGVNAGIAWNIGVWSGAHSRELLLTAPHTYLIASVALLPTLWDA